MKVVVQVVQVVRMKKKNLLLLRLRIRLSSGRSGDRCRHGDGGGTTRGLSSIYFCFQNLVHRTIFSDLECIEPITSQVLGDEVTVYLCGKGDEWMEHLSSGQFKTTIDVDAVGVDGEEEEDDLSQTKNTPIWVWGMIVAAAAVVLIFFGTFVLVPVCVRCCRSDTEEEEEESEGEEEEIEEEGERDIEAVTEETSPSPKVRLKSKSLRNPRGLTVDIPKRTPKKSQSLRISVTDHTARLSAMTPKTVNKVRRTLFTPPKNVPAADDDDSDDDDEEMIDDHRPRHLSLRVAPVVTGPRIQRFQSGSDLRGSRGRGGRRGRGRVRRRGRGRRGGRGRGPRGRGRRGRGGRGRGSRGSRGGRGGQCRERGRGGVAQKRVRTSTPVMMLAPSAVENELMKIPGLLAEDDPFYIGDD